MGWCELQSSSNVCFSLQASHTLSKVGIQPHLSYEEMRMVGIAEAFTLTLISSLVSIVLTDLVLYLLCPLLSHEHCLICLSFTVLEDITATFVLLILIVIVVVVHVIIGAVIRRQRSKTKKRISCTFPFIQSCPYFMVDNWLYTSYKLCDNGLVLCTYIVIMMVLDRITVERLFMINHVEFNQGKLNSINTNKLNLLLLLQMVTSTYISMKNSQKEKDH